MKFIASVCLLLGLGAGAQACEVRARWNDDPPYSMRLADGRLSGLNVEMVELVLGRMGCRVQWVELPWARALVELEAGRLDVLPGGFRRPEREGYAYFVAQHELSRNRLYVRAADRARVGAATRLAEVPGLRLGVQIGVVYGPEYAELVSQPAFRTRLTQATTRRSLWQMLELGRVDGVLSSEASARWELAQEGLHQRIVATDVVLSNEPAYVLVSKHSRDAAWAQRYQDASAALKAEGTTARVVRKYFGD
ncbi:substrate-binding periplasmic protein [Roseateles puraquae]|uniref:substrate-binding periplasmic protein n=1 Tax=Roseateles puraquae TaxID=431059 RepID=UPI0031E23EF8